MKSSLTADRLRLALKLAGIKAQELSGRSGVSKSSISQYVNGVYVPSNLSAGAMAEILGVNPLWLMGFDVPMYAEKFRPIHTEHASADSSMYISEDPGGFSEPKVANTGNHIIEENTSYLHGAKNSGRFTTYVVKDDSMAPEFRKGDVLTVDKNAEIKPGDYVLADGHPARYEASLKNIQGKIKESRRFF